MGQAQRKRVWVERWLMVCRELLGCCVCTPKQPTLSEISVGPAPTGSQLPSYLPQPKQPTPSKISVGPAPTGSQLPSYLPPNQATHAFQDFRWACPNGITTPQLPSPNPSNPRLPRFPLGLPQRDHNSPATFRQPSPNPSNPRFPRFPLGLPQRDHNSPATFRQPKQPTPSKISVGPAPTGSQLPSYLPPTQATHAFQDFRWACPNGITTPQLPSANPSNPRLPRFPLGLPQRDHNCSATAVRRKLLSSL